ncbi:glycosyltransferase [Chlorobium sp. KB01]|uniref:glycosyltransferase n=1 Tax=Chlorobium sp. KB01 TaxID=1917528 RepID=UPI000978340A|nr:glycosyltransferase [Chlorobium sp. KB01]
MNFPFQRNTADASLRLVWFSEIQWDFLSTRKQRLLGRFSERWRILFIEPFALGRSHHWLPVRRGRVWVVTVPFLKTVPFRIGRLLDHPLLRNLLSLPGILLMLFWVVMLGFASSDRIIGLSNIYWGRVASRLSCRFRFYDANDDHLAFPATPSWLKGYLDAWLSRIDLLFSVSPELTARLAVPSGVRTVELGNGVEFSHFADPRGSAPSELGGLKRPILGYAGAMDWLDTTLVEETAKAWPEYSLVLLGPAYEQNWWKRQEQLNTLSNVHYFGRIDYGELPARVQHFDLALMPLLSNRLKEVSHPNKLYEYTAAGVPVLSMNYCSAVDQAREVVYVADTRDAFVRMVPEALADRRREARQSFARRHSWDAIAATMEQELLKRYRELNS